MPVGQHTDCIAAVPSNSTRIVAPLLEILAASVPRPFLPLLGFLFLPLTTLAYAWMTNKRQLIAGINLPILIIAVVIDMGGLGGEYHRRNQRLE
jgi:hypothetical protein